jgi:hypothetical protein
MTTAASEQQDKRQANRNCRAALRRALRRDTEVVLASLVRRE